MRYKKDTFITAPNKKTLMGQPATVQSVYFWLCEHSDNEDTCYPSRATIAQEAGVSERTVDNSIKVLIDIGVLEKEARFNGKKQTSNLYHILIKNDRGRGATIAPSGATIAPVGGQPLRTELNPLLTQPNNPISAVAEVVSPFGKDAGTDTADPELCFYGFPLPDGWRQEDGVDEVGNDYHVLYDDSGLKVGLGVIKRMKSSYKSSQVAKRPIPVGGYPVGKQFLDIYAKICKRELDITPKFGSKEVMVMNPALKRYDVKKMGELAKWFISSNAKDEEKLSVYCLTSYRTINKYQADTGKDL